MSHAMNDGSPRLGLYDALYAISTFFVANLLWIICSLPLVTMPAATAALFSVLVPWARGKPADSPLMVFFGAMRRYWRSSTIVVLLDLLLGGVCALNLLILRQMGLSQPLALLSLVMTLALALALIVSNVYLWPLLVTQEMALRALLKWALHLALAHPLWGLLTAFLASIPLALGLILPQIYVLIVSAAAPVLIVNWGAWRVIRRYLDTDNNVDSRG